MTSAVCTGVMSSWPSLMKARPGLGAPDPGRGRHPDHVGGIVAALHTQRHPQVGVGQDVVVHDAGRALGRQDHVHAERAAHRGDGHQRGEHLGEVLGEHRELVDHQQQARHGFGRVGGQVGVEVVDVLARRGKDPLAALHLRLERAQRPVGQLFVEVGDGADGVRQAFAGLERGAALEVDEDEVQPGRVVAGREAGDQGAQELALARARGAADQAVRAVGHQVQGQRAGLGGADRGGETPGGGPQRADRRTVRRAQAQQVREPDQRRQGRAGHGELRVLEAGQVHGAAFGEARADAGDHHVVDVRQVARFVHGCGGILAQVDHRGAGGRKLLLGAGDDDAGDADALDRCARRAALGGPSVAQQCAGRCVAALGEDLRVEHQEHRRGRVPVDVLAQGAQHRGTAGPVIGDPAFPGARTRLPGVRQPGGPRPFGGPPGIAEDAQREVGGPGVHRRLGDQAAGHRQGGLPVADDAHHARIAQVHEHGGRGQHARRRAPRAPGRRGRCRPGRRVPGATARPRLPR